MQNEAEQLCREVEALPKQGRRRLYTADIRRRVVAFVEARIAAGGSESSASAELGIHQATVTDWRGSKNQRQPTKARRVRAVEVVEPPKKSGRVLVLGAARIEGLSVADIVALVKGLS